MNIGEEDILNYDEALENYADVREEASSETVTDDKSNKLKELQTKLASNVLGADITLCVFLAALRSYRADRCLRPFPPMFIRNGEKDFEHLRNVCDIIPPIKDIINTKKIYSEEILNLLSWLFIEKANLLLKKCPLSEVPLKQKNNSLLPQHVFEVCYSKSLNESFQSRKGDKDVFYAYHGSAIDNFYSILKVGLQQHFSVGKEVLFGNGIYLSSEISICTQYAPFGETWKNSSLGYKHSIIAVCEVINNVDKVKCRDAENKKRSQNLPSYQRIPEKYFIVTDSDMLRVKYLLVYSRKTKTSVKSFIVSNIFYIALLIYFCILALIGFFKGPMWSKLLKWVTK